MVDAICAVRAEIIDAVTTAQLAGAILPSLYLFNVETDIRVRVADGKVTTSVPVAVVHIDTDAEERIWLQLTKGEVEDIVKKLNKVLEDMRIAETLSLRAR